MDQQKVLDQIADQAMHERDLAFQFSEQVLEEISTIDFPSECPQRKDLRKKLWCSIDNDDSRDLDQLTYAEKADNGKHRIFVAIADVDSLVGKNSATDLHAGYNTTSVYTPSKIYPMLPEKLSTNLTSLNEHQDRCAIVAEVMINANGSIDSYEIYPARVHNYAKLAYSSVGPWLEGKSAPPKKVAEVKGLHDLLKLQNEIAIAIKQFRHSEGALTLQTIEVETILSDGKIVDLQEKKANQAHQLIENFMISANVAITKYLTGKGKPTLRRVVRIPKNWGRIVEVVSEYRVKLPETPNSKALEEFLVKMQLEDPQGFPDLSLTLIKLLGRGEYVAEMPGQKPIGHFDLALRDYAHTTAPNRRYPDLIMQRILKSSFYGEPVPYSHSELSVLARHCTLKEDDASKVERRMQKSAAAMFLSSQINKTFSAIVTGASDKGTYVRLLSIAAEGRVIKGYENLEVGDKVRVKLVSVNITHGFIDFIKV